MKLNELIIKEDSELTLEQKEFMKTHNNILTAGAVISTNLINLAQNLKKMRDEKLYKTIEYDSFEDYAEQVCGLKRRQAYSYIQVVENLSQEFVQSTAQIGITKLSLLASLESEEKEKIIETVAIEDVSVKQLKEEIKRLKNKNDTLIEKKAKIEEEKQALENQLSMLQNDDSEEKIQQLESEIETLRKQQPITVVNPEQQAKIESLERIISVQKNTIKLNEMKMQDIQKQQEIQSSAELTEFKFFFQQLQDVISHLKKLIDKIPQDKKEGCETALKKVGEQLC